MIRYAKRPSYKKFQVDTSYTSGNIQVLINRGSKWQGLETPKFEKSHISGSIRDIYLKFCIEPFLGMMNHFLKKQPFPITRSAFSVIGP